MLCNWQSLNKCLNDNKIAVIMVQLKIYLNKYGEGLLRHQEEIAVHRLCEPCPRERERGHQLKHVEKDGTKNRLRPLPLLSQCSPTLCVRHVDVPLFFSPR